ncbi:hypothetical protein CRP603_gp49 [Roseobacter phage CRP-603]|nr:hypothetical protein CRP603_gp49 [Roseobacter phage CRP-603]
MAKKFGGFTPQQQQTLLSKMGYTGPAQQDDINKFMMSSPKAASMMGKYAQMAKARVEGGPQMAMHVGGDVPLEIKPGQSLADAAVSQQAAADQMADTQDPQIAASNTAQAEAIKEQVRPQPMVQRPLIGPQGTTDPQSAAFRAETQRFEEENRDVLMAANEAGKRLQQEAMLEAGLTQAPQNQEEADRLNAIMRDKVAASPEIKAAQDVQNAFNQRMQEQMELFNQGKLQPLVQRPMPTPRVNPGLAQPQMRVRQNPQTGSFEVVNAQGKVVRSNLDNQQQAMQYVMEQRPQSTGRPRQAIPMPLDVQNPYPGTPQVYDPRNTTVKPMRPEDAFNVANAAARDGQVRDTFGDLRPEDFSMYAQPQYENRLQGFQEGGTVVDETQPEVPEYDPSAGLPTMPETPDYAATAKEAMQGVIANDSGWAADQTATLIENETIRNNPDDYTLRKDGKYYTLVYPDGTEIKSGYRKQSQAVGRAEAISKGIKAAAPAFDQYQTGQQQYQQNVDIYNQYTTGAAQEKAQTPVAENIKASQDAVNVSTNLIATYNKQLSVLAEDDPRRAEYEKRIADEQVKLNQANAELTTAKQQQSAERTQASQERIGEFEADPAGQAVKADVATVSEADREAGMVDETVGQAGEVTPAEKQEVVRADEVSLPDVKEAATYDAVTASPEVQNTLDTLTAATGKPSADALAEAQTMDPEELAQLGLTAAQIEEAVQVQAPAQRTIQEGELLGEEDVTVDMERVEKEALNFEAATGTPSTEATVQGQLTNLMEDFEGGETPAWAAGAMRAATQRMAARGLAASSMAGQAIVQAAMESAMPIAMADAQTMASFEAQNLSNRQAAAMLKAEQRAKFLGMEFDQGFQIRVQNAAKIADIANQNFTAEVQIALENARLANTVDLANLDAKNAKILSDAAAMSNMEIQNLNNRQQAAVQQANAFLNFDMKEFDAKQQVAMFKTQAQVNAILADTAAQNAAEQFNATSENQTNQFYDSLISQVQQFNVDQANAMERFEVDQANQMAKFNAEMAQRREEFNATNALIVAQANAKWDQEIALAETAATNAANRDEAQAANNMTTVAYEASKQADRDTMSYAFQTANNNADRATEIALQTMRNESAATTSAANKSAALATAAGAIIAEII